MRRNATLCALIGLLALLTACGGGGDDTGAGGAGDASEPAAPASEPAAPASDAAGGGGASLVIADFTFSELTTTPGAEVTVSNEDGATHTVTAEDESFDVEVAASSSGTFTAPDEAGEYPIVCKIHPNMKGTVTVAE